jgi:archaemetzincin
VKIAIVPMGKVDSEVLTEAGRSVRELFGCEVHNCAQIGVPADSLDLRRNQYSSVAFMLALVRGEFGDVDRVIGLTGCDLFIPMLTFVFGQAQLRGRIALVSLARLRQEFYGASPDPELLRSRLDKEIGHELGHCFGLIHCSDRECLMSLATSIQDVDRKAGDFCHSCRRWLTQEIPGSEEPPAAVQGSGPSLTEVLNEVNK